MESAIPASIVAVFRLIEFGLSYSEVSKETSELLENLKVIDRKINETKSLRRVKSGWLDTHNKNNIDLDIAAASNILKSIGATIESCRRDLAANNRVTAFNKLRWLFRDNQSFLKQERTLSNCLSALISDITTMQLLNNSTGELLPPPYDPHHRLPSRGPTLLGPNARRQLAKQKSSASLASFKTGDDIGGGHVDSQENSHRHESFDFEASGHRPFSMSRESVSSVRTHEGVLSTPEDFRFAEWKEVATTASITPMHTHDGHVSLPVDDRKGKERPASFERNRPSDEPIWRAPADYDIGLGIDEMPGLVTRSKSTPTYPNRLAQEWSDIPATEPPPRVFKTRSRNAGIS